MTDIPAKAEQIETCRWSLTLGIGLLLASAAAAGIMIPRLAGKGPLRAPQEAVVPAAAPRTPGPEISTEAQVRQDDPK